MKDIAKQCGIFFSILIILYFIVDILVFPMYTRHGEEFELNDFTEKTIEETRFLAEELGYEIIIKDSTFSPLFEPNIIIAQEPKAFSRVKYGRRIYLTVSMGDKPIILPNLVGISLQNANFIIEGKNLIVGEILTEFSNTYDKDVVMGQFLLEGTKLIAGDTVSFTVSLGEDLSSIPIADYTGMAYTKAKKKALTRGFVVEKEIGEIRDDLVPGTVISQSLEVGTFSELNETIIFTISQ